MSVATMLNSTFLCAMVINGSERHDSWLNLELQSFACY